MPRRLLSTLLVAACEPTDLNGELCPGTEWACESYRPNPQGCWWVRPMPGQTVIKTQIVGTFLDVDDGCWSVSGNGLDPPPGFRKSDQDWCSYNDPPAPAHCPDEVRYWPEENDE